MIGLFKASENLGSWDDRQYPIGDIEMIERVPASKGGTGNWWRVRRRGNLSDAFLSEHLWETLMRLPVQTIPADHRLNVVRFGCDEDGPWVNRSPLIGWATCFDGEVRPVTRDGVDDGLPFWDSIYIEWPDGKLRAGMHADDVESAEAGMSRAQAEWSERQAATDVQS